MLQAMAAMMRLTEGTRDRVLALAQELGTRSAEEAIVRLLDEHWDRQAIAAVEQWAQEDPDGWQEYVDEAARDDLASAPPVDGWAG